jgi:hypothetical protein
MDVWPVVPFMKNQKILKDRHPKLLNFYSFDGLYSLESTLILKNPNTETHEKKVFLRNRCIWWFDRRQQQNAACQSCTAWFEARVGHSTGTTALITIKTIKFVLLDDQTLPGTIRQLLQLLGLSLERKSRQSISGLCKKLVYGTDQITEEGIVSSRKHGRANYS